MRRTIAKNMLIQTRLDGIWCGHGSWLTTKAHRLAAKKRKTNHERRRHKQRRPGQFGEADVRRYEVSHDAFSPVSNRSMAARYSNRIRVRSDTATTISPPAR